MPALSLLGAKGFATNGAIGRYHFREAHLTRSTRGRGLPTEAPPRRRRGRR